MNRKKVLVYGYKKINLGDDLFFSILFRRYPDTLFLFPASKEYSHIFKSYKNVKVISPYSFVDLFITLADKIRKNKKESFLSKQADFKVNIIGSGFSECSSVQFEKMPCNNNLIVIGTNFGPYQSNEFVSVCKEYFSGCTDICFRDKFSYNLFSDLDNTRYAPDIVFDVKSYFDFYSCDSCSFLDVNKLASEKYAVISVISFKTRSKNEHVQRDYLNGIKKIAYYLISKGQKIVLFSFCDAEGDSETIDELRKDCNININSYHYRYKGNLEEALKILDLSETVIATRFHAMILGWAMNKKVLPVIYNQKMSNVLEDVNWDNIVCSSNSVNQITYEQLDDWFENYHFYDFKSESIYSQQHFKILDTLLEK